MTKPKNSKLPPWLAMLVSRLVLKGGVLVVLVMMACGCGQPNGSADGRQDEGLPAEAVAVRAAFAGSGPSYENPLSEMLKLVKAGKDNPAAYLEVIPQLQRLAGNPTITAQQKQALESLVEKLKADISNPQP